MLKPFDSSMLILRVERWAECVEPGVGSPPPDASVRAGGGNIVAALHSLVEIMEAKDGFSVGFVRRVVALSGRIADEMGLSPEARQNVTLAGLLHDIGRVALSDRVLKSSGRPLTGAERKHVQVHPVVGERILRHLFPEMEILAAVRHHHEWYDGNGYPDRLKGEQIPIGARILAVADAYVAMTQDRPYHRARSKLSTLREIRSHERSQFCPEAVAALARVLDGWEEPQPAAGMSEDSADRLPGEPVGRGSRRAVPERGTPSGDELTRRVDKVTQLKALPDVVSEVLEATTQEDLNIHDLAGKVRCDQGLSAKLLQLANSALYGSRMKIDSIDRAVVKLGVARVRQLVVGIGVVDQWSGWGHEGRLQQEAFWKHSIATALVAQHLADSAGGEQREGAYTAGLLHDVGQVILQEALKDRYAEVLDEARNRRVPLHLVEQEKLGTTHAQLMRRVAAMWCLPDHLVEAIALHHVPWKGLQGLNPETLRFALFVRIANIVSHALGMGDPDLAGVENVPESLLNFLEIDKRAFADLAALIPDQVDILGGAYGVLHASGSPQGHDRKAPQREGLYCSEDSAAVDTIGLYLDAAGASYEEMNELSLCGRAAENSWSWIRASTPRFVQEVVDQLKEASDAIRENTLLFLPARVPRSAREMLEKENVTFLVEPWHAGTMREALRGMQSIRPRPAPKLVS